MAPEEEDFTMLNPPAASRVTEESVETTRTRQRGAWGRIRRGALAGTLFLPMLLGVVMEAPSSAGPSEQELVAGHSKDEALRLGERMYRRGILPSGQPMRAVVSGDVQVDGTMFTCQSCHLRSGMGSIEGTVITQPTTGTWLYKPLVGAEMKPESQAHVPKRLDPPPFRPAYTDASLARALWTGKDPNGRRFHPAMPRYKLSRDDMQILVYYLKNLSVTWSPGVDDTTLRFATVVSSDVDPEERQAMVRVLEAHVRDRNSQSRHEEERAKRGAFFKEEKNLPYRRYSLDVWELKGDRESWPAQLEEYSRKKPVFAMLGGLVSGSWRPIHEFCERRRIPCLFPITDLPVVSDSDWYTLYFSKGLYQEGDSAARFLRRSGSIAADAEVVQVYRRGPTGDALVRGFAAARKSMGLAPALDLALEGDSSLTEEGVSRIFREHQVGALALWLEPADLAGAMAAIQRQETIPPAVFVSGSLLDDPGRMVPDALRSRVFLTHPYAFPEDEGRTRRVVSRWLKAKKIPETDFNIQAKMYFIGWALSGITKRMRDEFYRDYFLDIAGMMRDQYYSIAVYPRLSFGPGQRYAAKGCYLAQLSEGDHPTLAQASEWVIH